MRNKSVDDVCDICLCICMCSERAESAVDADVQGRPERVSEVRDVGAAERAASGGVIWRQAVVVVDWRSGWRVAGSRETGAQPYRRPNKRVLGPVLQVVSRSLSHVACWQLKIENML